MAKRPFAEIIRRWDKRYGMPLAKNAGVIEAAIAVQGAERRHLVRGQLEAEECKVLTLPIKCTDAIFRDL
jgi:hypothetical protein